MRHTETWGIVGPALAPPQLWLKMADFSPKPLLRWRRRVHRRRYTSFPQSRRVTYFE